MLKLNLSKRKNQNLFNLCVLLFLIIFLIGKNYNQKFFGFEYEDAFINSQIATSSNYSEYIKNFRTLGCQDFVNNECVNKFYYPGHYFSYSFYLFLIDKVISIENYKVHKIGNGILLLLLFLFFIFITKLKSLKFVTLCLAFSSCLPVVYVLNSALIENLSVFFGVFLMFSIFKANNELKTDYWKIICFCLIITLSLVKRENLIYLFTIPLIISKKDFKFSPFYLFVLIFIGLQIYINPFFTEKIESVALNQSTFSFEYFKYQFPVYMESYIRIDGFLPLFLFLLIFKKPTKKSLFLLALWMLFIFLYSSHYRSKFAIENEQITHFESFRYMFNTLPFLFGYFIISKRSLGSFTYKVIGISLVGILSFLSLNRSIETFEHFLAEENQDYHKVNSRINEFASKTNSEVYIYDNFELISIINSNSKNNNINIFSLKQNSDINLDSDDVYVINRFDILDMSSFNEEYSLNKIDSLSSRGGTVYSFNNSSE